MADALKRPTDPYDPAWVEYARQNPGLRRSLSAGDPADPPAGDPPVGDPPAGDPPATPDFAAFVPESFKGEDGNWDTAGFRASYDDLASFKAQADERTAALPDSAEGYVFEIPDDHQFPEGFDPASLNTKDAEGNEISFDVKSMVQADDPDIPALQAVMKEYGADPAMMGKLASIMANREIRSITEGMKKAEEETKKLGPEAKSRFASVERTLGARLPAAQVTAVMDGIVSADGLRAIETLLLRSGAPVPPTGGKEDWSEKKPLDRLLAGLNQRKRSA